jgi:non-heme chloroperoxidase
MSDQTGATKVDTAAIACPVLCVEGADDKLVSPATARASADGYSGATDWKLQGHGRMPVVEPGAEDIARCIPGWIPV